MIIITDSRIEEYLRKLQPEDDSHLQEMENTRCRLSHAAMGECRSK